MTFFVEKCISAIPETVTGPRNRFVEINATEFCGQPECLDWWPAETSKGNHVLQAKLAQVG